MESEIRPYAAFNRPVLYFQRRRQCRNNIGKKTRIFVPPITFPTAAWAAKPPTCPTTRQTPTKHVHPRNTFAQHDPQPLNSRETSPNQVKTAIEQIPKEKESGNSGLYLRSSTGCRSQRVASPESRRSSITNCASYNIARLTGEALYPVLAFPNNYECCLL